MMKHITKIYIAGPMTGYVDYNRVAFAKAADQLNSANVVVLNPGILPFGLEHSEYMEICKPMVKIAHIVFMLEGWHKSKGAKQERRWAMKLNKKIEYQVKSDEWRF